MYQTDVILSDLINEFYILRSRVSMGDLVLEDPTPRTY